MKEVGKRPEQGVYITKKRCAELDGAARLRLNFCDYRFPSGQTRLSVDETSLRCFSSGQNPFSPDGKTFLQFIKFNLAANVPQKAYTGTSLPRWREFECTLRRPPCQSELAEACESTSKTKAPVAATSLRAKTQKPTVSENKMSFAESEEACWRAKTKSSTRSRKTPFGSGCRRYASRWSGG